MAIHKIKIFTGRDSEYLAKKIAASFGTTLGQSEVLRFSDGEFQACYSESRPVKILILWIAIDFEDFFDVANIEQYDEKTRPGGRVFSTFG